MKRFPRPIVILTFTVFIIVFFTVGFVFGRAQGVRSVVPAGEGQVLGEGEIPAWLANDIDFDMFWDAWDLVKENYYRLPVSEVELFYGAMHGMLEALEDPYSSFFDPEEAAEFAEELS